MSEKAVYKRDVLPSVKENALPKWLKRDEYAQALKQAERRQASIRIGYFRGSITHTDDFEMILPAIVRILKENPQVELHIVGELELPEEKYRHIKNRWYLILLQNGSSCQI